MPATLPVELNREDIHSIEAPDEFTATGPFTIELRDHGKAVHVHLHLDDDLSRVAHLSTGNHYVEADRTQPVDVAVTAVESAIEGKLKIVTGYGNETKYVDITIEPPEQEQQSVDVDENLGKPQQRAEPDTLRQTLERRLVGEATLPVLAFAGFAILLALAVALAVSSPVVMFVAGVVIGGVLVALAHLWE